MFTIKAFPVDSNTDTANIFPSLPKRDWMDQTADKHAYNCFPLSLTNTLGWSVSFPEDISFIWDGIDDTYSDHVKILSGEKYVYNLRANATISFKTGFIFRTEDNVSLLAMPTPNLFIRGTHCFTTLISTSFYQGDFPIAWKITEPNIKIVIPAGTPVANIIPISLTDLQNSEIVIDDIKNDIVKKECPEKIEQKVLNEIRFKGNWTNFYRNATNACGDNLGNHEVKKIKLSVKNANN